MKLETFSTATISAVEANSIIEVWAREQLRLNNSVPVTIKPLIKDNVLNGFEVTTTASSSNVELIPPRRVQR